MKDGPDTAQSDIVSHSIIPLEEWRLTSALRRESKSLGIDSSMQHQPATSQPTWCSIGQALIHC
jgi:hypothetical protein